MWNPTAPKEEKNTADDNKNKEEVADCCCSDSSSSGAGGVSVEQQRQQATTLSTESNSKSKPQHQFGGKLSKDQDAAGAGIDDNNTTQGGAGGGSKFVVAETTDSGFISGPITEPLDYSDDEEKTVEEDRNATNASTSNAAAAAESSSDRGTTNRGTKSQIDECIDSGVIEITEYESEIDEAEVENDVDADVAKTEKAPLTSQVEREPTSNTTVANNSTTTPTTPASNKPTASNSNTATEGNDTMIVKHIVVGSTTEWTCDASNSNNLNTSSGRSGAPTTTTVSSQLNSANLQANRAADLAAGAAAAAISRASSFPWEQFYKQNDDGDTALHLACIAGCIDVITALIRMAPHPCLLNIRNDDAQTPLHLAALTAQPNVLRILLLAGAEPTIRDHHGNTALHIACISGEMQCVRALTETFAASEIHEAHRQYGHRSNDKAVSSLSYARLPSDLEIRNFDGERCVHLASQGGHIDVLRILVANGADINAREGKSGRTPLHIAIECRNEDLANFLLDECEKLNLETATYAGLTAYQIAQILNNAQMQNILQKRGAEPLTPPDSDYDSEEELDDSKVSVCC